MENYEAKKNQCHSTDFLYVSQSYEPNTTIDMKIVNSHVLGLQQMLGNRDRPSLLPNIP